MHVNELQMIPLQSIVLSNFGAQVERRKHYDKTAISELAESIKSVGLLQPIVARPLKDKFEVVAGERRYLAATQAGLKHISASVRELNDQQVLEVQLIENLQREGLHELAEAEGYEQLMKLGLSAEQVADKVGRSKAYVYGRLKLTALTKEARQAFYDGKLNASTALLLARIPVPALQLEALKEITKPRGWDGEKELMSYREAARHVHETYMLRLSDAGFKTSDASLVPAAGACGACPKRTGNQPELFGDVKGADVCTDPVCFKAKLKAHNAQAMALAKERGQRIITGSEAKKVSPHSSIDHMNGYVRLDGRDWNGKGTYRQSLGKDYVPTLLLHPESNKLIEVAPSKDLPKRANDDGYTDKYKAQQRTADKKRKQELEYRRLLFLALHQQPSNSSTDVLHQACIQFYAEMTSDVQQLVAKALGWEQQKKDKGRGRYVDPAPYVDAMNAAELWSFLRDLTVAGEMMVYTFSTPDPPKRMLAIAKTLGIDATKIRAELVAADKAKESAKRKSAKKKAATKKAKK